MSISDYYNLTFRLDLEAFMGQSAVPYFGHSWHCDCRGLEKIPTSSRPFFLVCLYFTVLVDQAMHEHFRPHYRYFEEVTRYPKFCHGLCQFQHNPRRILAVPVELGFVSACELHAALGPGMELFVAEVVSFAYSDESGHLFRFVSDTDPTISDSGRSEATLGTEQ